LHGVALVTFWNTPQFPLVGGLMPQSGIRVLVWFYEWCARFALPLIGLLSRFVPLAVLLLYGAARRTDKTLFEAAENVGASPIRASYSILWRTMRVPMLGVFGLLWALSSAEISVSVLTQQPGGQPLTLPIFQLMHIFVMDKVAALCLILCGFSALVMALCGVAARLEKRP
jgi:ABC-type Fe3+ transport system permease subunit